MERLKYVIGILIILVALLLIGWTLMNAIFNPITTIFSITVKTERIKFTTVDKKNSRLVLHDASIASIDSILHKQFEGTFEINEDVEVVIERISEGPIVLSMTCRNCESVGRLYSGKTGKLIYRGKKYIDIIIPDIKEKIAKGQTFIFNIDGKIETGRNIAFALYDETNAILRNGRVVLIGSSKFGNDFFEAGSKELFLGDRLVFDNQESKGVGFVVINENPGMEAAYRVKSKSARIIKPGPRTKEEGFVISSTFFDRILNDRLFKGLSFLIGILVFFITTSTFVMDSISFRNRK